MQLTGRVIHIGNIEEVGSNNFKKREVVIETEEQYSQKIPIQFVQAKTEVLNNYSIGDLVTVSINIRGNEWTSPQGETKWFASIQGWKIEHTGQNSGTGQQQQEPVDDINVDDGSDLAF